MIKRLVALALAALMLFAFAAVGMAEEEVELRVLYYVDLTAPNLELGYKMRFDDFLEAYPNIKIVREDLFADAYHEKLEAYAAQGNLPDLLYAWPSGRSTTLRTNGMLQDLTELIERDGLAEFYQPWALDPAGQVGALAIIPQEMTATNAFFVNKKLLADLGLEPAKTYSELVAQVPVLAAAGKDTIMMDNKQTWVMQSCLFSLIAGRFCGEDWEKALISGEAKFTDPDFVAALNFVKQMYDDGVINQATIAQDYGEGLGPFATDQAAYFVDGTWRTGSFITDKTTGEALISPERQAEDFFITVFPEIDVEGVKFNRSNSGVLGCGYAMRAGLEGAKLEAAWEWLKWQSSNELQTYLLSTGGISMPARNDIDYDSLGLEPFQIMMSQLAATEYDITTVVIDGAFDAAVYTPLNDGLQAIGMGTQTPEEVAQIVQDAMDAWLATQ